MMGNGVHLDFDSHEKQIHFHMKGFPRGLVLENSKNSKVQNLEGSNGKFGGFCFLLNFTRIGVIYINVLSKAENSRLCLDRPLNALVPFN